MQKVDNDRRTYLATEESNNDVVEHIENQLIFEEPYTKSIIGYFHLNPVVAVEPESFPNVYLKITNVLMQHPESLKQLVLAALDPSKVQINSAKQACISAKILKNCPKLVLFLLQRGNDAVVLFDFLKDVQNQTSLGYFNQIFDHEQQQFQNQVLKFFAGSSLILEVCFQKCNYEEVFLVIYNSIARSSDIGLIEFKKQIFLRFLSLSKNIKAPEELIENMMEMIGLILQNLFLLRQTLLQIIFDNIDTELIEQIGQLIVQNHKEKPNVAQYQLRMLCYILAIYKTIKTKNLQFNTQLLQKSVVIIIKVFQKLMIVLKDKPVDKYSFSNGESVPKVGLVRYYIFTLFRDILSLNQDLVLNNLIFNQEKHDIIETYLCLNKWNNMMHYVVEQCAVLLLKYERLRQETIKYTRCKDFLDFLIQQFKASQYIFLGTGNNSSYGNIYYIYNIARAVAVQLQNTSELQEVIKTFKPLQKFITADLQKFEIKMDSDLSQNSTYMIKSKPDSIKKLVRKMSTKDIEEVHVYSNHKKMMMQDEVTDYINKRNKKAEDKKNNSF